MVRRLLMGELIWRCPCLGSLVVTRHVAEEQLCDFLIFATGIWLRRGESGCRRGRRLRVTVHWTGVWVWVWVGGMRGGGGYQLH